MKKYDELSNKEKHNFEEFLILTFEFSGDELAVIDKQKPMTMELFSSCLAKCTEWGLYKLFERLLDEYPDLTDKYVKAIDDDIKDVITLKMTLLAKLLSNLEIKNIGIRKMINSSIK